MRFFDLKKDSFKIPFQFLMLRVKIKQAKHLFKVIHLINSIAA